MAERRCKQHPEHRQTKGVCPYCLRERLDLLSGTSSAATTSTSMDACSTTTFSSVSSLAESPKRRQEPLRKSRSLAFVIGEEKEEEKREKRSKDKKKDRFWSRLITAAGMRRDAHAAFKHSKTLKEKSSSSLWLLF